jgi:hypothetical protein
LKRPLTTFAAASTLLLIATAALWVASYFSSGYLTLFRGEKRIILVGSGGGVFVLRHNAIVTPPSATLRHDIVLAPKETPFALPVEAGPRGQLGYVVVGPLTFRFCWFVRPQFTPVRMTLMDVNGRAVTVRARMDQVDISYWMIVAMLLIAPACWLLRVRNTGLEATRACSVCGYDLRATPLRCPECGTVPSETSRGGRNERQTS